MIAHVTRLLLLIQAVFAAAIGAAAIRLGWFDSSLAAIATGIAAVLALRIVITLDNFRRASRFRGALPDGCRLNAWQTCGLIMQEYCATMLASSWTMPFRKFSKGVVPGQAGLPVLLVHGYGCNSGYWRSMSRALSRIGIAYHAVDLEPVFGSIDDYVDALQRAIDALCAATGSAQVAVVAHSMGGLAARAYMRLHGHARIAKLITLGTPHHGTALADHALGINTQQMRWTRDGEGGKPSEWLRQLNAGEDPALRSLIVSIYTHHDNIISPQTSSHLPGARNIELHGIGHVALASSRKVQALVIDEVLAASRDTSATTTAAVSSG